MVSWRSTLTILLIGSAISPRNAVAQGGAVSLTHTVMVTVPPHVQVQVGQASSSADRFSIGQESPSALSLSVSATQHWSLYISGTAPTPRLQWSRDPGSGFTDVTSQSQVIADGSLSPLPARATLLVRPNQGDIARGGEYDSNSETVVLTVVAQ